MRSGGLNNLQRLLATLLAWALSATVLADAPVSSIRVTADAQVTAKPDRVQVDLGVSTRAATSQEAAAQNARTLDAVLAAVRKAAGPAAVLKTVSYTLNPNYQYHPNGGVLTLEENSPHVMPIRFDGAARTMVTSAVATTPVESGTLDVSAQVTLSVEVGAAGH